MLPVRLPSRLATALATALLLVGLLPVLDPAAFEAAAAEQMVASFGQRGEAFAPMWPGGTFEQGSDEGLGWLRIVTDGKGGGTFVSSVRAYTPRLDATGKFIKVWVKVDDETQLGGMEFRLSSDRFASNYFAFSNMLYDDPDFNILRAGVWTPLTFGFGSAKVEGKPDRKALNSIGLFVSDRGNERPITVWWGGLSFVDEPAEGVVSITFDDAYDEHYMAAEMMAKYGMAGTAYVIPEAIGQKGYMTLHQVVDLQERFGWDIAAHHAKAFTEMSPDELETAMLGVQRFLQENQFGDGVAHVAYPLGKQNTSLVRPLARKHFATARLAAAGPETLPPADPHLLRVFNVTPETKPSDIVAAAARAEEDKEWLILMLHYLVEKPTNILEYGVGDFDRMLEGIAKTGVKVLPISKVWKSCNVSGAAALTAPPCALPQAVASPKR